jgi:hypothetical protein
MRALSLLTLLVVLYGCATPAVPGATLADRTLQRDLTRLLGQCEAAKGGDHRPQIADTQVLSVDQAGVVIERWTVRRPDRLISYDVRLSPSARGGVDINFECGPDSGPADPT